jgi:hypothetical protein
MPKGASSKGTSFSSASCGRVVGGHQVERAVEERRDQAAPIRLLAQRRVHLVARRVERGDRRVGEREVVRGHLAGDPHAALLGPADLIDRFRGGDVADMDPAVLVLGEHRVAGDGDALGDRRDTGETETAGHGALVGDPAAGQGHVLLVEHQRKTGDPLVLERAAHHAGVRHGVAVVAEAGCPELGHLDLLGQLPALLPTVMAA